MPGRSPPPARSRKPMSEFPRPLAPDSGASAPPAPTQLRAEQVCLAPTLFRTLRVQPGDLAAATSSLLINQVSFSVFPGDRLAIVGASGAGKTTLLRLLNRLSEPTQGQLYFNDQPYANIAVRQLRQQVMLLLQETKLLGMTVHDAIAYPLQLRGLSPQTIRDRVAFWCDRLQIPTEWRDRTEQQLSVGQRQRVAIARALATEPAVLLLDEPNAALDVGRSHHLLDLLLDLNQHHRLTILCVSHQLDFARSLATRVLHLQTGHLIQDALATAIDWHKLEQQLKRTEQAEIDEWT